MSKKEFISGDKVFLLSDTKKEVQMVIEAVYEDEDLSGKDVLLCMCIWFDTNRIRQREEFPISCICK